MDGIHDMGGMQGFGRVPHEMDERVFHAPWEARVHGMVYTLFAQGMLNIDAFRHAIERIPPKEYLGSPYYGRWARAVEVLLIEAGALRPGELQARIEGRELSVHAGANLDPVEPSGFIRPLDRPRRFALEAQVRVRNLHPSGHTRLPGYVRGKRGVVVRLHPACVLPDTNAHGQGECPEYLFAVRFTADELWGDTAESAAPVTVDLFDRYLEPA